jgi:hypothetical protein
MAIGAGTRIHGLLRKAQTSARRSPRDAQPVGILRWGNWGRVVLVWACVWPAPTYAAVILGVGTSLSYDTNVGRVETNPRPDWIQSLVGGVLYTEKLGSFSARAIAQVEWRHFYRGTFSDDRTGFLDESAIWTIVPQRLTWVLDDTFREVLFDVTAPDTPGNRTKSNSLNTGPDLTFAVDSANAIVFSGRYGRFDVKNSNGDNHRYSGIVRGLHAFSPQTSISLNYEAAKVFFEPQAQIFPEVLLENWFARFQTLNAGNGGTLDVGTSKVTRYTAEPLDGRLLRAAATRALSRQLEVRFAYADQISDTYSDQIRGIASSQAPSDAGVVGAGATNFGTGDLYHTKRGELGFSNRAESLDYTLLGYARRVDFFTFDQNDYDEKGGRIGGNWISGARRVQFYADYTHRFFTNLDRTDIMRNYGLGVDYKLNGNITVSLFGSVAKQDSTVPGNSFVDQRVMLAVGYSTGRGYDIVSRR